MRRRCIKSYMKRSLVSYTGLCTRSLLSFPFFLVNRAIFDLELGAESKEKHGVWDPIMPELTITTPYIHSRVDSNTLTMGNLMRQF